MLHMLKAMRYFHQPSHHAHLAVAVLPSVQAALCFTEWEHIIPQLDDRTTVYLCWLMRSMSLQSLHSSRIGVFSSNCMLAWSLV